MLRIDPIAWARRQLERDRDKTTAFEALFPKGLLRHKMERMSPSPLAFLRGAAPLFYEVLAAHPELQEGPEGEGWLVGDLHLENFGAYRPDAFAEEPKEHKGGHPAVFDLNDFDDAVVGPWRLDVLRLVTSLILGGRELGAHGTRVLGLAERLLEAYSRTLFDHAALCPVPPPVAVLIDKVCRRSRKELLDGRTEVVKGARRFQRGDHYQDLPAEIAAEVPTAFHRYVERLDAEVRPEREQVEILDAAFRIAGTGSLGSLRVGVVTRGKGGDNGAWIFDIKEEGTPSACEVLKAPEMEPGARVATALRACLAHPPRMVGTTELAGRSMLVRRLSPQEDKLDLSHLRDADLDALASYLGGLLGQAHGRGARTRPAAAWTQPEREQILDRAIAMAGLHEAVYLAFCRLAR